MARLYPRVSTNLPATIGAKFAEGEGVIANLSIDGMLLEMSSPVLDGALSENTVLLKYSLSGCRVFEHSGRIIREEGNFYAVKLYDLDDAARVKLWKYIADKLADSATCPYCGERSPARPETCAVCGWKLAYGSPEYFAYHERQSLFRKLSSKAEGLGPGQLQKLLHFMEVEILKETGSGKEQEFVGTSKEMLDVFSKIRKVGPTDLPVLILGESGTGKELTALAVHERSPRKDRPLVTINCAAIPEGLLEAELFGYERGAFTGAYTGKRGKFECADGSTLFLDEIGDMPLSLQAKLLRFLQDNIVERIGALGGKRLDVRLIAATNRDLGAAVAEGKFRSDLFYRLDTFTIKLPPVRERGEDKVILAQHFLKKFSREMSIKKSFAPETMEAIGTYGWPGNVREIINKVRRSLVMSDGDSISTQNMNLDNSGTKDIPEDSSLNAIKKRIEMQKVVEALNNCSNISKAARKLGISRASLYNYKKKYCI